MTLLRGILENLLQIPLQDMLLKHKYDGESINLQIACPIPIDKTIDKKYRKALINEFDEFDVSFTYDVSNSYIVFSIRWN